MNERIEAIVSGRVQMVMYRDFATRKARRLGITGTARNLSDGTVEIVAEGPRANLERFIKKLKRGPLLADVKDVTVEWKPATGEFSEFTLVLGTH
jgi:acylphosphatase